MSGEGRMQWRDGRGPRTKAGSVVTLWVHIIWVVVKIMVPFWLPKKIRHLLLREPKKGPYFDNYPYMYIYIYTHTATVQLGPKRPSSLCF